MSSQIDELLIMPINAENKLKMGENICKACSFQMHYNHDVNTQGKAQIFLRGKTVTVLLIHLSGSC